MDIDKLLEPDVLVLIIGGVIAVVAIVGHAFNVNARSRAERDLKAQMLDQGRSAEEIERILLAGKGLSSKEAVMMNQRHLEKGDRGAAKPADNAGAS